MGVFFIVIVGWVFSVCLHEYGHAVTAFRGGDYSVKEKGYLTFNPFKYAHPVYSLLMPVVFVMLGGIGLPGGAVYINRALLRSKLWETGVSLAGPAMNLGLAILIGATFRAGWIPSDPSSVVTIGMAFLLQLQVSALLLNLLPLPPLDGFQAIAPWLPRALSDRLYAVSNQALFILFLAMWYIRPLNMAFWDVVDAGTALLGAHPAWGRMGWREFRFWE